MKIKELVKQVEKTNEFLKSINKERICIYVSEKNWIPEKIYSMKDLKKWMKRKVLIELREQFLNQEYKSEEPFELTYIWFDGYVDKTSYTINCY